MRLVGRSAELGAVAEVLGSARGGRGGLLVLTGPAGSGRSALLAAAAEQARANGQNVLAVRAVRAQPPGLVWATLLSGVGANQEQVDRMLGEHPSAADVAAACRTVAESYAGLIAVDDVDAGGPLAVDVLGALGAQLTQRPVAVVATSATVLGTGRELPVTALDEAGIAALCTEDRPEVVRAIRIASRGLPGPASALAAELRSLPPDADPVVSLALRAEGDVEFLDVDLSVVRLLQQAVPRAGAPAERAVLLAKLARELLGDTSTADQRRRLLAEAAALAEASGDAVLPARVLEARLHALWAPDVADERLAAAEQIMELARAGGDLDLEVAGAFWRFVALVEAGRINDADNALVGYARIAPPRPETRVLVLSRQAMLATLRGRFDEACALAADVAAVGEHGDVPDTSRLVRSVQGAVEAERGSPEQLAAAVETFRGFARRFPGHFYEASAAFLLLHAGRTDEACVELERVLPRLLTGSGPRLLGSMTHAAETAVRVGSPQTRQQLYTALLPYAGKFAIWGGANTCFGPVDRVLGLLATALDRPGDAVAFLERAAGVEEQEGALPGLARSLAALAEALQARGGPGDPARAGACRERAHAIAVRLGMTVFLARAGPPSGHWSLRRDGPDWLLEAGAERARLRDCRGLGYLAALLANPRAEMAAGWLVAGGSAPPAPGPDTPVVDRGAVAAYRRRLDQLAEAADAADRGGDRDAAAAVEAERSAVLAELRGVLGLAGRRRPFPSADERARVSVTKAIRLAVDRVEATAPLCGAHLRASLRTGRFCRYEPGPGGPAGWHT